MDYYQIGGLEGDYFLCERLRATLTVKACATRYRDACCESLCHKCPDGALHSGQPLVVRTAVARFLCSRCNHSASRLVTGGLCVSCYNRQREVIKGVNAKGTPPQPVDIFWQRHEGMGRKTFVTHHVEVGISHGRDLATIGFAHVAHTLEAMLNVLRKDGAASFVRRPPTSVLRQPRQLSLFAGV